jgi:hypothetical protein
VALDERIDAHVVARGDQLGQLVLGEGGDDEQAGVGAHQAGVGDVPRRDGEVLAQHRDRHGRPALHEVGGRAAEVLLVGEDAEAGGPAALVRLGQRWGDEVGDQRAERRRAALHLRDDGQPALACGVAHRALEAPGRRHGPRPVEEVGHRAVVGGGPGPVPLQDGVEVRGHAAGG